MDTYACIPAGSTTKSVLTIEMRANPGRAMRNVASTSAYKECAQERPSAYYVCVCVFFFVSKLELSQGGAPGER
jgi:hypothetical protein